MNLNLHPIALIKTCINREKSLNVNKVNNKFLLYLKIYCSSTLFEGDFLRKHLMLFPVKYSNSILVGNFLFQFQISREYIHTVNLLSVFAFLYCTGVYKAKQLNSECLNPSAK